MTTSKRTSTGDKIADKKATSSHQQQILFDDTEQFTKAGDDADKLSKIDQQIIFDQKNDFPVIIDDIALDDIGTDELTRQQLTNDTEQLTNAKLPWLWRLIISLFMLIVLIEGTQFFIEGFSHSPFITSIYAALFTALSVVSVRVLWQEFVGLRQFKHQQVLKQQAITLLSPESLSSEKSTPEYANSAAINATNAEIFCQKLNDSLPCDLVFNNDNAQANDFWQEALLTELSSKEIVQLYSRVVLNKVDEKALNEVAKFSTEAVVLVALSPVAIIDMLVMLSRNLRMINKIAGLYGLKLGYWSRIKLIKQVFVNMAYAGASEIISDFGSDMLGAELLGKLSARFAQGLGAGMLTARLGIQTMQLCRPIPFDDKPKLNHIRKKISKQIKVLVNPTHK
jgi:putative membrane protein